jgi:type IV secretory pathway TrbD component
MTLAQRILTMDGPPTGDGVVSGIVTSDGVFGGLFWIAIGLGVVLWVVLARSSLVHGGDMERSDRVPQLYGYSVCLIAIVVMLVNVSSIVNQSFTLSNPLAGDRYGWGGVVLTSFEAYKATVDRANGPYPPTAAASNAPKPTDAELRAQFEALRADQIARGRLESRREMTNSVLMLLLAGALFTWHWRWVRRERLA